MSDVFPALDEALRQRLLALRVRPSDVVERFVRGAGPGGQKINKTSSTVTLRHEPTGLEVRCQQERSQAENRAAAWAELARRLALRRQAEAAAQQQARELERRRNRRKSERQKARQIADKHHRAGHKQGRRRVHADE